MKKEDKKMKRLHHCSKKKKIGKQNWFISYYFRFTMSIRFTNSSFVFIPNVTQSKFIQSELHTALLYSLFHMIPRFHSFHENCWLDISALGIWRKNSRIDTFDIDRTDIKGGKVIQRLICINPL